MVHTKKDEKIHLIDWKTCSWGWRREKKSDKTLAYQLVFYKHFYAQKYEVDPKHIECHFVLLKRTRTSIFLRFLYGTHIFLNLILMFPSNGSHFGYFLIFLDMLKVRTVVSDLCHSDPLSKCDFLI